MDFEPIANISTNETFDPDENYYTRQNAMDVPILLSASAGLVADCITTYIIMRNKNLRTRTNIYIVNYNICNIFYLLFTPLLLNLFSAADKIHAYVICFSDEIFFVFMLGNYMFIGILLIDWYIVTYKSLNSSLHCRASYKLTIASVWAILLVFILTTFLHCMAGISSFAFIAFVAIIFYFCLFILVIYILIMKIINEKTTSVVEARSTLEFVYVISYFLCWLPNWAYLFGSAVTRFMYGVIYLGLATFTIGFLHPVILLLLMYHKNQKLRIAFRKLFFNIEPEEYEDSMQKSDEHFTTLI